MTVKELKNKLEQFDENMTVFIYIPDRCDKYDIEFINKYGPEDTPYDKSGDSLTEESLYIEGTFNIRKTTRL